MNSLYAQRLIPLETHRENPPIDDDMVESVRSELYNRLQKEHPEALREIYQYQDELRQTAKDILNEKNPDMSRTQIHEIITQLTHDIYGWGPINPLLQKKDLKQVWINRFDSIRYEDSTGRHSWPRVFRSEKHLRRIAERMASTFGRGISESSPGTDCRLPDGSRVSIMLGPSPSVRGTSISIRPFPYLYTLEELCAKGLFPKKMLRLLILMVKARLNLFTAGAMGSGKNTFLSALFLYVGKDENIIFIEDPAESKVGIPDPDRPDLPVPNVKVYEPRPAGVEGKGEVTLEFIFEKCLRQQPDRIMSTECRSRVTTHYTLMAMAVGQPGSGSTIHANSAEEVPERLAILLGEINRNHLQRTTVIDIIFFLVGFKKADGFPTYHRITEIAEVTKNQDHLPEVQPIYQFDFQGYSESGEPLGELKFTGRRPEFLDMDAIRWRLTPEEYAEMESYFQGGEEKGNDH